MDAFATQLAQCLQGRVCVVGVGNAGCGDDALGVLLAERCRLMIRARWDTPPLGLPVDGPRSADFSPQEATPAQGRSCGPKPALLTGSLPPSSSAGQRTLSMDRSQVGQTFLSADRGDVPVAHHPAGLESPAHRQARKPALPGSWPPRLASGPRGLPGNESPALLDREEEAGQGITVVQAGLEPERYLTFLADQHFDHVLFVDAVEFGGRPGEVVLLDAAGMTSRFPQVSTHKLSLGLMGALIEGAGPTRVHLLGVQPASVHPGAPLSSRMQTTLELLADLLEDLIERHPDAAARPRAESNPHLVSC